MVKLTKREFMILQLSNPAFQGDLLHNANQYLPAMLEEMGYPPTNSEELKNLIIEIQAARTMTAFSFHRKMRKGEVAINPPQERMKTTLWIKEGVLLHIETETPPEEMRKVMDVLFDIPGMENVRILVTKPEENTTVTIEEND